MKKLVSKWKGIAIALVLTSTLLLISWEYILAKSIKFILSQTVVIDDIAYEKDHWILINPHSAESSNILFKASQATFNYSMEFWKGKLDLYVTLEKPEFWIDAANSFVLESNPTSLLKITQHLKINTGTIHLNEQNHGVDGELLLGSSYTGHFHINFNEGPLENNQLFIHFTGDPSSPKQIELQCQQVDCFHLHQLAKYLFPTLADFKIDEGVLHGTGGIFWGEHQRPLLYAEAHLKRFNFEHLPTKTHGFIKEVDFHLQKNLENSFGTIIFSSDDLAVLTQQSPSQLRNIDTKGSIHVDDHGHAKIALQGIYANRGHAYDWFVEGEAGILAQTDSFLDLTWNLRDRSQEAPSKGIEGHLSLDANGILKLFLKSHLKDLFPHISDESFRQQLSTHFHEDEIAVTADLKLQGSMEVEGLAQIIGAKGDDKSITFGFQLVKKDREGFGLGGISVKNGWFHALNLPLEKYVAPFFLEEKWVRLTGHGDFHGYFENEILMVTYQGDQVVFENDAFAIEIVEIRQELGHIPVHYFDLNTGTHYGSLSLDHGAYYEKGSGLCFSDIHAEIILKDKTIHVPEIETFCNEIYMTGALDVDFTKLPLDTFEVDIRPQTVQAKMTQVQNFFSYFQKSFFFLKIPLEGDVTMQQDAGHLHLTFSPNQVDMQMQLKGALTDGLIVGNQSNVSLHELSLNFAYDHQANSLNFSDIQGTLLVGAPERVEEYTVVGEKIHFFDYAQNRAKFDIWMGDKKRDVIRLAGETRLSNICAGAECVQFVLDKDVSHFGNVYPQIFHLILKDWEQVEEFHLAADFKLDSLFQDLQRFSRTGFLFLSRHALAQLNAVKKADGTFKIDIQYDNKRSQLDYRIIGKDIALDAYAFKNVLFEGRKSDDTWVIDQLVFDDISMAADILRKSGSWLINFLGLRLGNAVLMGLQGEYFDDRHIAKGKINLLEVDVEALKEWSKAAEFLKKYPLKGDLKASGPFYYEGSSDGEENKLDLLLNTSLKNGEFNGLLFDDICNASLHYTSDKGFMVRGISTNLRSVRNGEKQAALNLEKFDYDRSQDIVSLENLDFIVFSSRIPEVIDHLAQRFPIAFSPFVTEMLSQAKQNGNLEGSLSFDYADPHYAFKLALKDGEYRILNKKLLLSDCILEYDPCEVKIIAKCQSQIIPFWLQYKSAYTSLRQGELIITEDSPANTLVNPLTIKWENTPELGFSINQVLGQFHGMTFALAGNASKDPLPAVHFLDGEIQFNVRDAMALISPELGRNLAAWEMGSCFSLKGQWELHPNNEAGELIKTYFAGHLEGHNLEFKGYQFDHLYAEMCSSPEQVFLKNVHVTDPAGNLQIAEVSFKKTRNDIWKMNLSKVKAQNFTPSLLKKVALQRTHHPKPFVIRELAMDTVQGILGNSSSFSGIGSLTFVNPPKTDVNHILFTIPREILTRFGLDMSILNPVIGTIYYEIKQDKIFLNKLKDTYSQAKMSKFYLPNNSFKSYMDFDGNLNIKMKIKQYNLFFKIAELFTITIEGTWQKPAYSIQKQKK